jgi:hypothetical protein
MGCDVSRRKSVITQLDNEKFLAEKWKDGGLPNALTPLDQNQVCGLVTIKNYHPWTLPDEEHLAIFPKRILIAAPQVLRGIGGRQEITEPISQLRFSSA